MSREETELVERTLTELLKELRELGEGEKHLDTGDKVAIIKTKTTVMDQLLKQHERVMNIKRIAAFQSTVISILDDYVGENDRQAFLKRMELYVDQD